MRFLVILMIAATMCGCKGKERSFLREIEAFVGREIYFSDSLKFCDNGTGIGEEFFKDARFKIVNYIDTSGCEECKLHLFDWGRLQRSIDTLNLGIKVCFVVWSNEPEKIEQLSRIHRFNIPIIADTFGVFLKSNPIPEVSGFRTCLVDSCNRVILVGSPLYNEKLLQLYIEICLQ